MGVGPGLGGCGVLGARLWMSEAASLARSSAFLSSVASSLIRPSTRRTTFPITGSSGAARASLDPALWTLERSWSTSCHLDLATTWRRMCAVAFAHSSPLTWRRLRRLCSALAVARNLSTESWTYKINASIEASRDWLLNDFIRLSRLGTWVPCEGAMSLSASVNRPGS
jgi:hypothetical protein